VTIRAGPDLQPKTYGLGSWPGCTPIRVSAGLRDPSVSADVLFNECGQPVFDGGNRSRAVLMVLFVAQHGD